MFHNKTFFLGLTGITLAALFFANLICGSVPIPIRETLHILLGHETGHTAWSRIILESRLPQAITATFAGASLATAGLLLQTFFKNPLAGPSILGISDGAGLGVALIMLLFGNTFHQLAHWTFGTSIALIIAALTGAGCVLSLLIYFSTKVTSPVMLLITGLMVGYLASSLISLLNYYASADRVRAYVLWGMGNFSSVSNDRLPFFAASSTLGLTTALLLTKPLNALLLGEAYAQNLGVKIKTLRILLLLTAGLLTATTTAMCGPIAFLGLAVPHIARLTLTTADHATLLPATLLTGAAVALLCNLLAVLPGSHSGILPLNAVTPLIGAPVILYVILHRHQYFK
jgi:iron complex transport system permease protein